MKKSSITRRVLAVCLIIAMLATTGSVGVSAASKDVTKQYKKPVTKLLRNFDSYLGYGCKKSLKVKFDIYAKSTMMYFLSSNVYGKSLSQVRSLLKNKMKLYFGKSANAQFKRAKSTQDAHETAFQGTPSNLVQNVNGKVMYVGGDWGENGPRGYVKKILKKGANKFEVTYRIMWYAFWEHKIFSNAGSPKMGEYKITLKKAKNKYGFVITGMKRTKANVNSY